MTSVAPAHGAAPPMAYTPDPAASSETQTVDDAATDRPARPKLRDQIAENPLASLVVGLALALFTLLGTVVVALLVFALNSFNDRFDSLEARMDRIEARMDRIEARMDRLERKVDAGFAAQAALIAELDRRLGGQIAELDRRLAALIAHLNATAAVDAALEHRLLVPGAGTLESPDKPPS